MYSKNDSIKKNSRAVLNLTGRQQQCKIVFLGFSWSRFHKTSRPRNFGGEKGVGGFTHKDLEVTPGKFRCGSVQKQVIKFSLLNLSHQLFFQEKLPFGQPSSTTAPALGMTLVRPSFEHFPSKFASQDKAVHS